MKAKKVWAIALAAALTVSGTGVLYAAPQTKSESGAVQEKQEEQENTEKVDSVQSKTSVKSLKKDQEKTEQQKSETTDKKTADAEKNNLQSQDDSQGSQKKEDGDKSGQDTETGGKDSSKSEDSQGDQKSGTVDKAGQDTGTVDKDGQDTETVDKDGQKKEDANALSTALGTMSLDEGMDAQSLNQDTDTLAEGENLVPDAALAGAIRDTLGLEADAPITKEVLEQLNYLSCFSGASSLEGLQYAVNLTSLWVYDGSITDMSPVLNLKKIYTLDLSNNNISSIPKLSGMDSLRTLELSGNPISQVPEDVLEGTELQYVFVSSSAPAAAQIFEKYISYEPVEVVLSSSVNVEPKGVFSLDVIQYSMEANETAEITSQSAGNTCQIGLRNAGTATLKASVGNVVKEITIRVSQAPEEVGENPDLDELPQFPDNNTDNILYEGGIWNTTGEEPQNISGDIKVRNYVSCVVYYGNYRGMDLAAMDENSNLYYWEKDFENDSYGQPKKIADEIQQLFSTGYIDKDGNYHHWKYYYEEGESRPQDLELFGGVSSVNGNIIYMEDGSATYFLNGGSLIQTGYKLEKPIKEIKGSFILDVDNTLWRKQEENYSKVADNVSDFSQDGNYISNGTYYTSSGTVIDQNVDRIDGDYGVYYVKGNDYYQLGYTDGQLTGSLVARDVKCVLGMEAFLLNNKELWIGGTESGYKILTSVEEISGTYGGYNALRTDGTVWRVTPPLVPYKIFQPTASPSTLWSQVDESTGIQATAENIPENIRLVTQAVTADSQEFAQAYGELTAYMNNAGAKDYRVYDIKLVDEEGKEYQPETGNLVTVTLPKPEGFGESVKLYHQHGGSVNEIPSANTQAGIVFQTDSFSLFGAADFEVTQGGNPSENPDPDNGQGGGNDGSQGGTNNGGQNGDSQSGQDKKEPQPVSGNKVTGNNKTAQTSSTSKSVKTGDETPVLLYGGIMVLGLAAAATVIILGRRKRG